jgi:hypothetical protein
MSNVNKTETNKNEAQETTNTTNTNNLPSVKNTFSLTNLKTSLASQGFNGINIDFASFPVISQKGAQFSINGDSSFCDQELYIKMINSQNKFVLTDQGDKDSDFIKYSYDGIVTVDGENIDDLKISMLEAGKEPVLRRNLEVFCQLVNRDDNYNNRLAFVSISATSASRASGFLTELELMGTLKDNPETVIKISKGAIKSSKKGNYSYFLWQFDIADSDLQKVA